MELIPFPGHREVVKTVVSSFWYQDISGCLRNQPVTFVDGLLWDNLIYCADRCWFGSFQLRFLNMTDISFSYLSDQWILNWTMVNLLRGCFKKQFTRNINIQKVCFVLILHINLDLFIWSLRIITYCLNNFTLKN